MSIEKARDVSPAGLLSSYISIGKFIIVQVKALELRITPDIGGGEACAKLKQLRLA